jgi:tetratricopeptide (TPR) repeat protein
MNKIFVMASVCIVTLSCNRATIPSQTAYANAEIKNEQGNTILAGHCSLNMMQQGLYKEWFDKSYDAYTIDTATVAALKSLMQKATVEIFLGSWCGDSKREVPRMIKILQAASFDTLKLKIVFVDNSTITYKQSPQHEEAGKNIFRVPTFIVYNDKEIGRIVESPVVSLEEDLLAILEHRPYTANYKAVPYWYEHVKNRNKVLTDEQLQILAAEIKPICSSMGTFNAYGYVLLAQKNFREALNIFRLNTLLYPENAGTYDSLGEAYITVGDKLNAKKNYQKALELKPGDVEIMKALDQLQ